MPAEQREAFIKGLVEKTPVGHGGTPEEAGEAFLFAMKCTYLTGQTIFVDGGSTLT